LEGGNLASLAQDRVFPFTFDDLLGGELSKKKKNLNNDQSQPSSVCWSAKTKDPKRQQEKNKKKRNPKVFFLTNTHSLFTLLLAAIPRRSRH
jgi:hypothetical protein